MTPKWLYVNRADLAVEHEQLLDEGKDVSALDSEFQSLAQLDLDSDLGLQPRVNDLLDAAATLPMRCDFPFDEPSDLAGIRRARPEGQRIFTRTVSDEELADRVLGAWLGRCAGCLLGKPVEGWRSYVMWPYLKELGQFPLSSYFRSDVPDSLYAHYNIDRNRAYVDRVNHMPEDDDTNYTVSGLAVMKEYGKDFQPKDVAQFWLDNIPITHCCTAERVAYKNFVNLVQPPASAGFRNPYREWIGAQIRADFFGYAALGNPELAAEFAWRDACISHIKNGIYGEMWVAAMLAAAPFVHDMRKVIEAGLSEIPRASRLAADIRQIMVWRDEGIGYEETIARIHKRWNEDNPHHWCHTNSNAQIVTMALLWGEGNYEMSVCRAVEACFDTDCNGATVGSIFGMMYGAASLPQKWIGPLNDGLETGIAGYHFVHISGIAREGFEIYQSIR